MQIRVANERMQEVDHVTRHGGKCKIKVPVVEAKLVLVEMKPKVGEGYFIKEDGSFWHNNEIRQILIDNLKKTGPNTQYFQPILISETEVPSEEGEGESAVYNSVNHLLIHKPTLILGKGVDKKVLALPEHFSPDILQQIVNGTIKDGDGVLVECEQDERYVDPECPIAVGGGWSYRIKLNSESHITLHKFEEKRYTKEEWFEMMDKIDRDWDDSEASGYIGDLKGSLEDLAD